MNITEIVILRLVVKYVVFFNPRCHFPVSGEMISSLLGLQAPLRRYSSPGESGANFALVLLLPSPPVIRTEEEVEWG
jgi:hypothetical protein